MYNYVGEIYHTIFVNNDNMNLLIAHIYLDNIVFVGMSGKMVDHFFKQVHAKFEMSMFDELTYFLRF